MGDSAESPAKVERNHSHCSPLKRQACLLIIEVYQVCQACNNFSVDLAGLIGES